MRFIIYPDAAGEYRWKLVAKNGRVVADSGEGYHSLGNVRRALKSWRRSAADADVVVQQESDDALAKPGQGR